MRQPPFCAVLLLQNGAKAAGGASVQRTDAKGAFAPCILRRRRRTARRLTLRGKILPRSRSARAASP
ncbi:MAG: hypothetical protein IJU56_03620 [Clostridia bacterium]|nr:hypothetical protein [Clostridia bacterium]